MYLTPISYMSCCFCLLPTKHNTYNKFLYKQIPTTKGMIKFTGSSPFSGVSSLFTGVSDIFTSLFRRASLFPGVSPKLLIILVSTRFFSALLFFLVFLIPVTRSS